MPITSDHRDTHIDIHRVAPIRYVSFQQRGIHLTMPSYTFDHIHLVSPDPEKTADFYEKTFGAKKSVRDLGGGMKAVSVDLDGTKFLIRKKNEGEAEKPSLDHFGIRTDNLEQAVADLKAQGIQFTMEIRQIRPDMKISFLRTPDDVSIELQQGTL